MTKNIEICKAEEVGAQVLDIRTTAERQAVAAINAAFGLAIPLPAAEPGEITELPAAVSAHDRQLLAQTLGKPEPAATLSTTDPLATFVATLTRELYRHFAARTADYLPADFPDPFARNLAHLLSAVQSLSPRKISNGSATNDGLPDGISLAHLLCSTDAANSVTELVDDNSYVCNKYIDCHTPVFPNLEKITLGATENTAYVFYMYGYNAEMPSVKEIHFPNLVIGRTLIQNAGVSGWFHPGFANLETITFPKLREIQRPSYAPSYAYAFISRTMPSVTKLEFPELVTLNDYFFGGSAFTGLQELRMPKLKYANYAFFNGYAGGDGCPNLLLLEVGAVETNLNISFWSPTLDQTNLEQFLVNFRDHIALRLTDQGSGLTLTLSQAVRNAIHAAESTYGIEDIIVNQKHWTLSPAPSA